MKLTKKEVASLRELLSRFINEHENKFIIYDGFAEVEPNKIEVGLVFEVIEEIVPSCIYCGEPILDKGIDGYCSKKCVDADK